MKTTTTSLVRRQLQDRRQRLGEAIAVEGPDAELVRLLRQVDSALGRLDKDDYGTCLVCSESVDEADLERNGLMEYCLCNLTTEQQNALQHDLQLARRIQSGLLPDPELSSGGWQASYRYDPAGVVSGDFCDLWVAPRDPGALYFAVGDVSGKGVAASLLMVHLHAAFRSLLGTGVPLAEMVECVNRQLMEVSLPSHYATLACGRADEHGNVELVNAGHCPPLLVSGGAVTGVAATGYPIGLLAERPWEVRNLHLGRGDSLVLYTDGLTEARRPDGEEYGQERIERLLAERSAEPTSRQMVHAVRSDLASFLGDTARSDDLTVLVLRRDGNGHA